MIGDSFGSSFCWTSDRYQPRTPGDSLCTITAK